MPSVRISSGILLAAAGVTLLALVSVPAGVVMLIVGAGLLLPLGGGEGDETSFEWTDLGGGGDGGGGGGP